MAERNSIVVSITMSKVMKTLLDAMSLREGLNRSQYIRLLLAKELQRVGILEIDSANNLKMKTQDTYDFDVEEVEVEVDEI
tara:strand:+ start:10735 stop:10977 length:243 start_codon:yes stop_codon:yes gene_type:complete